MTSAELIPAITDQIVRNFQPDMPEDLRAEVL
jgi:hypothetical protein